MKKRLIFCTLLGLLFMVLPKAAQADVFDFDGASVALDTAASDTGWIHNGNPSRPVFAGVQLGTADVRWWEGGLWQSSFPGLPTPGVGSAYSLDNATINIDTGASLITGKSIAAVVTDDHAGTFYISDINLTGNVESLGGTHSLYGFLYFGNGTAFDGTVNGGNVTVNAEEGEIVGVYFRNRAIGLANIANGAVISFDNIDVETGRDSNLNRNDGASGFAAGNNGGAVTLGNVKVYGGYTAGTAPGTEAGWATGVELISNAGTLAVGSVEATGTNEARGLLLHGDNTGSIAIYDEIKAVSEGRAYGVNIDGNASGSLTTSGIAVIQNGDGHHVGGPLAVNSVGLHAGGDVTGNLKTGKIDVNAEQGRAVGINVEGNFRPANGSNIGEIVVESANANATGIRVGGTSAFALTNDITVNANGPLDTLAGQTGYARGVHTFGDAVITIAEDVKVTATSSMAEGGSWGFYGENDLTLGIAPGKTLNTNSVHAGQDLTVLGNGRANLNLVNVTNNFNIGAGNNRTTVAVDGVKMIEEGGYLGNVRFGSDESRLLIYGNTTEETIIGGWTNSPWQIVSMSALTQWGYDETIDAIRSFGVRSQAFANDNYLAASQIHQKYTGLQAVRDHVISGATVSQPRYGYYGQNPCDCVASCSHGCGSVKPRSAWANYIGRHSHYRSSFNRNDWHFMTDGVQVGTDIFRNRRNQVGAFFGYEDSTGRNLEDRIKAKDFYVGMYGVHVFNNGIDMKTVFNFGWQDFNSHRYDTLGNYQSTFDGDTVELNVELGRRCYFGPWSSRPSIALDWYLTQLGGGWENGTDNRNALRYDKTDLSQLFFRFGSDLRYERGPWAVEGGLYYSYDMRGGDFWSGVSDVQTGALRSALVSSKLGRSVLTMNLSGSWLVCQNLTLFGGYRGEATPERAGNGFAHTGYAGGAWRW